MKSRFRSSKSRGFTIVEVLVVLSISAGLLLIAIFLVNGKTDQAEFNDAIGNVQSQLTQIIDDVSNGYYPNNTNFSCSAGQAYSGTSSQGTNNGCIFIGKEVQFRNVPAGQFNIYTVYGAQRYAGPTGPIEVTSYQEAKAKTLSYSNTSDALDNGLTAVKMYYCYSSGVSCDGSTNSIDGAAFLDTLASYQSGSLASGATSLNLIPIVTTIKPTNLAALDNFAANPVKSINICLASGTTNQSGLLTFSQGNGQIAVNLSIKGDKTC